MRPHAGTPLVWTGASCTYGCPTCPIARPGALPGTTAAELRHELETSARYRGKLVLLAGGEPFLRADLFSLIAAVRTAGSVPGMITTARPLVYPHVREKLRRAGLAYLRVQLFGIGEAHDRAAAVPGAFEQVAAGTAAWIAEAGPLCDVDLVLTVRGQALETLVADLGRASLPAAARIVIELDPQWSIPPGDLRRALGALAGWNDDERRPLLAWSGLPPELAAGIFVVPPLAPHFLGRPPAACCLGATAPRHDRRTEPPVAKANSFNFMRTRVEIPLARETRSCGAAERSSDPARQLWLVEDDRLVLHATDTADFGHAEIARIKDELSHLFVDCAPPGVLDDIVGGMRRVLPDPVCETCARRPRCARRFRIVEGPPFAREEAWIADYIGRLCGRVLDVGCGEQLYRPVLAPRVRSGAVCYRGLDPDARSLEVLRREIPEGDYRLGDIEHFEDTPQSYDHVLCLRALNHVVDLDVALARMSELLRPGGQLLVVECTPFALLRNAGQIRAADRAPRGGHQHFRNLSSHEVLPFARRCGLRVLEHRPAERHTTNEWILLLERPGAPSARDLAATAEHTA